MSTTSASSTGIVVLSSGESSDSGATVSRQSASTGSANRDNQSKNNKQPNYLRNYSSVNCIFTLACLTPDEINNPDETYRVTSPQVTILRSGGGAKNKVLTAYETPSRQVEYFIDNVEIESIIAPSLQTRTSNATMIRFEVHEPYSMGLFLQTLQLAAEAAGGTDSNYLKAPYALIMEFIGHHDDGTTSSSMLTRRVIPVKFSQIEFAVDAGGSKYTISCFAWNEQSQSDVTQTVNEDTNIKGATVRELLQTGPYSLTNKLNQRIREGLQENTAIVPDEFVIIFPESLASSSMSRIDSARTIARENAASVRTDTTSQSSSVKATQGFKALSAESVSSSSDNSPNQIGKSRMLTNALLEAATLPFGLPDFALVEPTEDNQVSTPYYDNGRLQIDPSTGEFTFPGGTSIEKIIEEIVILSEYGQNASSTVLEDKQGSLPWFRIHTQTYIIPDEQVRIKTGENPKIHVYTVVKYDVHSSVFAQAANPSVGIDDRKSLAAKEYNYIYTGKNEDVIDVQLQFNAAFFTSLSPGLGNTDGDSKTITSRGAASVKTTELEVRPGNTRNTTEPATPIKEQITTARSAQEGGDSRSSARIQTARQFNEAIVNSSVDLITMDLTIMGDPYYISDTGLGNYNSPVSDIPSITRDGTMNYQMQEVEIVVNFRTPIDYNEQGTMTFPEDTVPVNSFSGLYRVNTVVNKISNNTFEQVLSTIRRPNQTDKGTPGNVTPLTEVNSSKPDTNSDSSATGNQT